MAFLPAMAASSGEGPGIWQLVQAIVPAGAHVAAAAGQGDCVPQVMESTGNDELECAGASLLFFYYCRIYAAPILKEMTL